MRNYIAELSDKEKTSLMVTYLSTAIKTSTPFKQIRLVTEEVTRNGKKLPTYTYGVFEGYFASSFYVGFDPFQVTIDHSLSDEKILHKINGAHQLYMAKKFGKQYLTELELMSIAKINENKHLTDVQKSDAIKNAHRKIKELESKCENEIEPEV